MCLNAQTKYEKKSECYELLVEESVCCRLYVYLELIKAIKSLKLFNFKLMIFF